MRSPGAASGRRAAAAPRLAAWLLLAASISGALAAGQPSIRGLDPALAAHYRPQDGRFACLDRSGSVAFDRVNDDFCDCADGSDEPGTSACPAGRFYCRNRGHQPRLLNSSAVGDRICDCCDGSDEAPGVCANTCAEAGAANRAALKARSAAFRQGLKARARYVREAVGSRQRWQADVAKLKAEEAALTKTVGRLQAKKARIEKQEAREREREEAARKLAEQQEEAAKAAEGQGEEQQPEADAEAEAQPEGSQPEAAPADSAAADSAADDSSAEEELSEEEKGRRIAAQWTHDPEAVGESQQQQEQEQQQQQQQPEQPDAAAEAVEAAEAAVSAEADDSAEAAEAEALEEEAEAPTGAFAAAKAWLLPKLGLGSLATPVGSAGARQKVKDEYFAGNSRLTEIARQRAELEGRLKLDFGPEDAYMPLIDRCFEARIEKYVYEVCPFKSAAQKDGGMSTSLGTWQGLQEGPVLAFGNGQHCWNGPNRSLRVALECGAKEELSAVEEPSRCEYKARLTSPAACSQAEAEAVQRAYEAAEAELATKDELRRL